MVGAFDAVGFDREPCLTVAIGVVFEDAVRVGVADQGAGGNVEQAIGGGDILDVQMTGEHHGNTGGFEHFLQDDRVIEHVAASHFRAGLLRHVFDRVVMHHREDAIAPSLIQFGFEPMQLFVIDRALLDAIRVEHIRVKGDQMQAGDGFGGVVQPIRVTVATGAVKMGEFVRGDRAIGRVNVGDIVISGNNETGVRQLGETLTEPGVILTFAVLNEVTGDQQKVEIERSEVREDLIQSRDSDFDEVEAFGMIPNRMGERDVGIADDGKAEVTAHGFDYDD